MGQDSLSREEATEFLDQRVHILMSTQEMRHLTRNFVKLVGEYLGEESPIYLSMASWPHHIDHFEQKYDKAFTRDPLFGADLVDRIHKRVQVFLHSCNTKAIEEVESGALAEFGELQKRVERVEWITSTLVWVKRPAPKEEGRRKSDGKGLGSRQSGKGGSVFNHGVNPQLRIIDNLGSMTQAARTENFRLPVVEDGREICLQFSLKEECNRSCTRSHAPLRIHTR